LLVLKNRKSTIQRRSEGSSFKLADELFITVFMCHQWSVESCTKDGEPHEHEQQPKYTSEKTDDQSTNDREYQAEQYKDQ